MSMRSKTHYDDDLIFQHTDTAGDGLQLFKSRKQKLEESLSDRFKVVIDSLWDGEFISYWSERGRLWPLLADFDRGKRVNFRNSGWTFGRH